MSLHGYEHVRIVVQNEGTTVFEAARAMRTNEVGCVVVVGGGRVVGIVTDRDLVLRVVAEALDRETTCLHDVMTRDVATLPPHANVDDALRVMRERRIRRVPLVDEERVVGMVTLDDLLFDGAAPRADSAAVVRAQMIEGGPARTRRFDEWKSLQRRHARADATRNKLVIRAQAATRLGSRERAKVAIWVVVVAIVRRLAPAEASKVVVHLPALYRTRVAELPPGPDASITRETVEAEINRELEVEPSRAAEIAEGVGRALADDAGLVDALARFLPHEMMTLFPTDATPVPPEPVSP